MVPGVSDRNHSHSLLLPRRHTYICIHSCDLSPSEASNTTCVASDYSIEQRGPGRGAERKEYIMFKYGKKKG